MPLADATVFAGYTILRLLGVGGMGEVYLVRHPRLPRREALKVLPAGVSADPAYRRRFAREADLAAALWHPHIVEVHDRGEHDGQLWITMDYVEGTDAAHLLRERYPDGMPAKDALDIVSAIADALDYAHERNLLHRDVKPANVLIADAGSADQRILLADFGIARDTDEADRLTATDMTVGTVDYAAPEQLTGKTIDGRADQYALACTAFHLLTGRPPFANSTAAAVIGDHLSSPPPRIGALRADLHPFDDVFAKAMAKAPSDRFGGCREFASALNRRSAAGPGDATQPAYEAPVRPRAGADRQHPQTGPVGVVTVSRRTVLTVGAVAALVIVGLAAFVGGHLAQPHSTPSLLWSPSPDPSQGMDYREPVVTVTEPAPPSVTVIPPAPPAPPAAPSVTITPSRTVGGDSARPGDLGLRTPISFPRCNGQGIVILGSVTTPGLYAAGVQRLLDAHPGAFYLRTDRSCPSLRHETATGNPIYAVFALGGNSRDQVCRSVRAAGGGAYGKWLDDTTDPDYIIPC